MSQLLTQCPFCQTTFKVSYAQMQAANGVVRCGACMEVFLASQHRVILKERPAPVIVEDDEDDLQWDVTEEDEAIAESAPDDTDTFTSWEEEEDYSRTETLAWFPGAEAVEDDDEPGWQAEQETDEAPVGKVLREEHAEEPGQEHAEAQPANEEDRPAYSGQLNPAGYSMTQFTVESLLSGITGLFGSVSANAKEAEEASEPVPAEEAVAEKPEQPDHDGEQFRKVPAPTRTAIIVPDRTNGQKPFL